MTILRTKLHPPRPSRALVERETLIRLLNQSVEDDLTLIVSPAGYGKTTLIAEWARQADLPVAWLSLDESDNDLPTFISYLVAAVQTLFPDACPTTAGLMAGPVEPPVDVLAPILVNEIDDLPRRFVLVLDDVHALTRSSIYELLDRLVQRPPLQMHLMLSARSDPPLSIGKVRASGRLTELRLKDLRFSLAESERYCAEAMPGLDPLLLPALVRRTEGWVAGMQLASLTLRDISGPASALMDLLGNTDDRFVLDYVSEQVIQHQSPEVRAFLLKTAILRRLCDPLAAAVAAPGAEVSLAQVERAGLFLTALDSAGVWFAFHGLFRGQLLRLLEASCSREEIADLHQRAATWYAEAGMVDEALHHATEAGDAELAIAIARRHLLEQLMEDRPAGMHKLLALLPADAIERDPWLLIAKAYSLNALLQYDAIGPVLQQIEQQTAELAGELDPDDRALIQVYVDWLWVSYWAVRLQPQPAKEKAERALAGVPRSHPEAAEPGLMRLPVVLQWLGEFDAAEAWLNARLADAPNVPWPAQRRLRALFGLTNLYLAEGYLDKGRQLGLILLNAAREMKSADMESMALLALGGAAYYANDLQEAVLYFEAGIEHRYGSRVVAAQESMVGLALSYHALGRREDARGVLTIMSDYHREVLNPQLIISYRSLQARLALLDGDLNEARRWSGDIATEVGLGLGWMAVPVITNVRVQIAGGMPDQLTHCLSELDRLLAEATRVRQPIRRVELLALKAVAHLKMFQPDQAAAALRDALAVGEPRGLIRPIVSVGRPIDLLLEVVGRDQPSVYIQRLLDALRADIPQLLQKTVPYLTPREKEVLALLAEYQTDRSIAETLVVSPLTVRTHIENIAEKLEVRGRRNVVTRARELGLLA